MTISTTAIRIARAATIADGAFGGDRAMSIIGGNERSMSVIGGGGLYGAGSQRALEENDENDED